MARIETAIPAMDRLIWTIIGTVLAIVIALATALGFRVEWASFALPAAAAAAALLVAVFYTHVRPDARLVAALTGAAQLVAFTAVGAPLSYIAASAGLPLVDDVYAAADTALGFDWIALYALMNDWRAIQPLFAWPYASMLPQIAVLALALAFFDRGWALQRFLLAFAVAALVTIGFSALLPALGPPHHYGIAAHGFAIVPSTGASHIPVIEGLRDGSFRVLTGLGTEGIICMPSLHAASAVLLAITAAGLPVLRWPFLLVNVLMLLSTPIEGSHYLVDVIAGIALGLAAHAFAGWVAGRVAAASPAPQVAI